MNKLSTLLIQSTVICLIAMYAGVVAANTPAEKTELPDTFPKHVAIPGGIAIVDLAIRSDDKPVVTYLKNRVLVRRHLTGWQALVGIPLSAKAGIQKIKIRHGKQTRYQGFKVADKKYETRHITIKNKRMVSPTAADIKRHRGEKKLIIEAIHTWQDKADVPDSFTLPVEGRFSSRFGLRRIYNNQKRIRRHTGLDIAAPVGTPIVAPAVGKVISTGDYFFTGGTVFIDHGQGLLSMYSHLSKTLVKPGDELIQGQRIGDVGMSGRVSGPHLHWTIFLNRFKVDPELFFELSVEQANVQ